MIRTLLSNPRRVVKTLLRRDFFLQVDKRIRHERLGSAYGGWDLVTDSILSGSIVYSFGVGQDVSFDAELIRRFGVTVHAFDPTPGSIAWVAAQHLPPQFVMHEYGVAAFDGDVTFYPPENPDHISHSILEKTATRARGITVPMKSLGTIMRDLGHGTIDLLKMDIEGAEYQVLASLLDSQVRPHQILVEFHHRFDGVGIGDTRQAVRNLKKAGYRLFSVSSSVEEFCFTI